MKIRKSISIPSLFAFAVLCILLLRHHGPAPIAQNPPPAPKPSAEAVVDRQPVVEQPIVAVEAVKAEPVVQVASVQPETQPAVDQGQVKKVTFTIKPRPPQMKMQTNQ